MIDPWWSYPSRYIKSFNPPFGSLLFIRMFGALGFAVSIPFLSIYLNEEIGVSMSRIGLMLAAAGTLGSGASSVGGALSDKFGRKSLLIGFLSARTISFLVLAYLVWIKLPFLVFASVYILSTLLGTSIFPIMDAIVSDVVSKRQRTEAYGLLRVVGNIGWAVGPAIGGIIVVGGFHLLFTATAAMLFAAAITAASNISETWKPVDNRGTKHNYTVILKDRKFLRFLIVCLLMYIVKGQLVATMSVHASSNIGLSKTQIGTIYFLNGGMVALLQVVVTRLIKHLNPLKVLILGCLFYAMGFALVGQAASLYGMLIGVVVVTIGEMLEAPTATAYVSGLAPEGLTGTYMGGFNMIIHLGWTVGPLVGGVLMDRLPEPIDMWRSIALLAVFAAGGFLFIYRSERKSAG